jgi:hypothetical protein
VIFFGVLPEGRQLAADPASGFTSALRDALWFEVGLYAVSAMLMLLLPNRGREQQGESSRATAPQRTPGDSSERARATTLETT